MLVHLPIPYLVAWLTTTALQWFVVFCLVRWRTFRIYPFFSLCVAVQATGGFAGLLAAWTAPGPGPSMTYFAVFYLTAIVSGVATLFAAGEVCAKVFGPRIGIPDWIRLRLALFIGMSLAAVVAINVVWSALNGGHLTRAMVTTEQSLTVMGWAVFSILWVYSHRLGISWHPRVAGIVLGYVLYLSIAIACVFVRARWPGAAAEIAGLVGMLAYLASLVTWGKTMWGPEPAREPATPEMMQQFEVNQCANVDALVKLRSAIR
jgi:hypothetical protein